MNPDIRNDEKPVVGIVIPCYNEEAILIASVSRLLDTLNHLVSEGIVAAGSFVYLVDDGSRDRTWELIRELHERTPAVKGLRFGGNAGHQNAIMAGMLALKDRVAAAITIDADLQDDVGCFPEMIREFRSGSDIVYGVRRKRDTDPFFKRWTAVCFYRLIRLLGADVVSNHADFRLISKRGIAFLAEFQERNLFLRGIFPTMKLPSSQVLYDRLDRIGGIPKYTVWQSLALALDGITSFSIAPLRFITFLGFCISILSLLFICWGILSKIQGYTIPGWASIIVPLFFLGGMQMFSMGIMGEYIAKIYIETKRRPRYMIDEEIY